MFPVSATYCASKQAALAVSDALRIELKAQGTHVINVYAGYIDTDMTADVDAPKVSPQHVARQVLAGSQDGRDHVLADERAETIWKMTRDDLVGLAKNMQERWEKMDFPLRSLRPG